MICTSIQGKTLEEILSILGSGEVEMAEIRLDLCELDEEEIGTLFSESDVPLIATCRLAEVARRVEGDNLLDDAGKVLSEQGIALSQPRKSRHPAEEFVDLEYRENLIREGKIRMKSGKQELIASGFFKDFFKLIYIIIFTS